MAGDRVTGIFVQGETLEWCTVRPSKGGGKAVRGDRFSLREATGTPEGEEPAESAVVDAIRARCARVKGAVVLGLPDDQVLIRVVALPTVDDEEIAAMAGLQADKFSPFPIESMVVSHEVLRRDEASAIVAIAVARALVADDTGQRLKAAGLTISRVDAAALARIQVLRDAGEIPSEERHLAVVLEDGNADLMVFDGGTLMVTRHPGDMGPTDKEGFVEEILSEIDQTLMSMEIEHGGGAPASVAIWCRGAEPHHLARELADRLPCRVDAKELDTLPAISSGLATRHLLRGDGLDLTPPAWRLSERAASFRRRVVAGIASIAALWLLCAGAIFGGLYYEEQRLANLEAERDRVATPAMEVRTKRRRLFLLKRYTQQRLSALECLREISIVQPRGIDLTIFSYRSAESLKISGEAEDVNRVYDFKNKLDTSKLFPGTTLQGPIYDRRRKKNTFDIEIQLPEIGE